MKPRKEKLLRVHHVGLNLNERELRVLERYMKEQKLKSKSEFIREVLFTYILKQNEENSPTLFD